MEQCHKPGSLKCLNLWFILFQRDSVQIGQKFTIGHDGVQRLIPNNPTDQLPSKLTDRDVSRLWVNDDLKLRNIQQEVSSSHQAVVTYIHAPIYQ